MKRFLFVSSFVLFFALSVYAGTCSVPDINISISGARLVKYTDTDYGSVAGSGIIVTCNWSFDPAPSTNCRCSRGDMNCFGGWMTNVFQNGDFNVLSQVPQFKNNDIDCRNAWCATNSRPKEDRNYSQQLINRNDVTHVIQCGFREGQNPDANQLSKTIKLHTYPSALCMPPTIGNFDLDSNCQFHDNEIMVNNDYIIEAGVTHRLVDTNVRFYNPSMSPHNISVRGEFDYNGTSKILTGVNHSEEGKFILGFIGILFIGLISFFAYKIRVEAWT